MKRHFCFIFFDPRSGSTYLARNISRSIKAAAPPETNIFSQVFDKYNRETVETAADVDTFLAALTADPKFSDLEITPQTIKEILPSVPFHCADGIRNIYDHWCDNNDPNTEIILIKKNFATYISRILGWFPESKLIWLIRDGRGVYLSKKNNTISGTGKKFANSATEAAFQWISINKDIEQISDVIPTLKVRYEDFLTNPKNYIVNVATFLGMQVVKEEREAYFKIPKRYGDNLHKNVFSDPITDRIDKWKQELSAIELKEYELIASAALLQHEYDLQHPRSIRDRISSTFLRAFQSVKTEWNRYL